MQYNSEPQISSSSSSPMMCSGGGPTDSFEIDLLPEDTDDAQVAANHATADYHLPEGHYLTEVLPTPSHSTNDSSHNSISFLYQNISGLALDPAWDFGSTSSDPSRGTESQEGDDSRDRGSTPISSTPRSTVMLVETQGSITSKVSHQSEERGSPRSNQTKQRRRESNRTSQRAFRERKEKHRRCLEAQLIALQSQHRDLLDLSAFQNDRINHLRAQIAGLTAELESAKSLAVYATNGTSDFNAGTNAYSTFDHTLLQGQSGYYSMNQTDRGSHLPPF